MPTRTEAINKFLSFMTHADLASLYSHDMECQVNVAQDGGERKEGDFKGKRWHGWTDSLTMWKSFRIPYKANTEPEYDDKDIRFDLAEHADAIGMTGWDWANKCSRWVAFDFDAIIGTTLKNNVKLTIDEMNEVKEAAKNIPWVTIRKSTSGKGLHLYVKLNSVPTINHNEHAALARAILGKMSALTGFDFQSKVDICGGNMWVWARRMKDTDGLELIKDGEVLKDIPVNWPDHIKVITGKRKCALPQNIEDDGNQDLFDELTNQRLKVDLDKDHKRLINFLKDTEAMWWWSQDQNMLVCHTYDLKLAHKELGLKGHFNTIATGKDRGNDHNCFCYAIRKGGWIIRRFSPGVQEDDSWEQDSSGWTKCYLNRSPDLRTAAKAYGGLEDPAGGFIFREAEVAHKVAELLGADINFDTAVSSRQTKLKQHKDGRLIVEIARDPHDQADKMPGWLAKGNKPWTKIFNARISSPSEPEVADYDEEIRHIVTESEENCGWLLKAVNIWRGEPLIHVKLMLKSKGYSPKDIDDILGSSVARAWKIVNKPFQPEYPGNREWNRNAAQLRFTPSTKEEKLEYPTWTRVLEHCGSGLGQAIKENGWCKANGIKTGGDYLKCWIAALFQEPTEPLPYIFLYGPQNSGKSIFHEALSELLTKGYMRVDAALINQSGFNAELEGAIVCVVEETDLRSNKHAYNRIKDWVTSRDLLIHAKMRTPYHIKNTCHFIQCANEHLACPIFTGDTRITMCYVEDIDPIDLIPKRKLIDMLIKEAPEFLKEIIRLEIPESNDRLNVPVVDTGDKLIVQQLNQTALESFVDEKCLHVSGRMIKLSEFYDRFIEWCEATEAQKWTKQRVGKEISPQFPKGRSRKNGQFYFGNICWAGETIEDTESKKKLALIKEYLEEINE